MNFDEEYGRHSAIEGWVGKDFLLLYWPAYFCWFSWVFICFFVLLGKDLLCLDCCNCRPYFYYYRFYSWRRSVHSDFSAGYLVSQGSSIIWCWRPFIFPLPLFWCENVSAFPWSLFCWLLWLLLLFSRERTNDGPAFLVNLWLAWGLSWVFLVFFGFMRILKSIFECAALSP